MTMPQVSSSTLLSSVMIVGYMASELSRMLDSEQRGTFTVSNLVYGTLKYFEIASVFSQSGRRKSRHTTRRQVKLCSLRGRKTFSSHRQIFQTQEQKDSNQQKHSQKEACVDSEDKQHLEQNQMLWVMEDTE